MEESKWIRIDEKTPENKSMVFYYFGFFDQVYAGFYKKASRDIGRNTFYSDKGFLTDDVTYWMPRGPKDTEYPEPPTIEERRKCLYHPYNGI